MNGFKRARLPVWQGVPLWISHLNQRAVCCWQKPSDAAMQPKDKPDAPFRSSSPPKHTPAQHGGGGPRAWRNAALISAAGQKKETTLRGCNEWTRCYKTRKANFDSSTPAAVCCLLSCSRSLAGRLGKGLRASQKGRTQLQHITRVPNHH